MNKFIAAIVLLSSLLTLESRALAYHRVDERSTWNEILRTAALKIVEPKITIGSSHVSIFSLCIDDSAQVLREAINVCQGARGSMERAECVRADESGLSLPIVRIEKVCVLLSSEGGCERWGTYQAETQRSYIIPVYSQIGNDQPEARIGTLAFTKRYDVPSCR